MLHAGALPSRWSSTFKAVVKNSKWKSNLKSSVSGSSNSHSAVSPSSTRSLSVLSTRLGICSPYKKLWRSGFSKFSKSGSIDVTSRRWNSKDAPMSDKEQNEHLNNVFDGMFATDKPKSREEVIKQAESYAKLHEEALAQANKVHERLIKKDDSVFSQFHQPRKDGKDVEGMSPAAHSFASAESLRSSHDIKIRRNTILRKTLWYTLGELTFDKRTIQYLLSERKLLVVYALLTAGLLTYAFFSSSPDYDFFNEREFEEEQRLKREKEALAGGNAALVASGISSSISEAWESTKDFARNFSPLEPFKKAAYMVGGAIVSLRMLHSFWKGDPLSEDERLIAAQTPISLLEDLRPDEYQHVSPLLRILATGHIPVSPWTAVIPPSPWAPHLTLVVDTDLLYSVGFNSRGERVMRKRPFADYFLTSLSENAEIILTSCAHSKTSAKSFFKLFDPHSVASHTLTAEDHLWDGLNWKIPLEERYLGRKPERLVVLQADRSHCGSMCNNVLRVKPWQGVDTDTTFLELTPLMKYMAAGIEEGLDTRNVISKYEGNSSAKDVIREHLAYTGIDVPKDNPLEERLRAKYAREKEEIRELTEEEFSSSVHRVLDDRAIHPSPDQAR